MSRHPLVLKGRRLLHGEPVHVEVGVDPQAGTITAVGRDLQGERVVDHGDGLLLPGAVDIHVHLRDPGHPHKEDFHSGTRAALAGGVTTLLDMPNTDPATLTLKDYEDKRKIANEKAVTDWGLWGGTVGDMEKTLELARLAPGLKVYLGESTGQVMMRNGERLSHLLQALAKEEYAGVLAFHAEAQQVLERTGADYGDEPGLVGHEARRPVQAELVAFEQIRKATGALAAGGGSPLRVHIAHVSTLELLQAAREQGYSCGVTPHHLLLHSGSPLGGYGRVNPPLRSAKQMTGLFAQFAAGRIPILESDHAPHTREEKHGPVDAVPSGMPGVETLMPVMLARALQPSASATDRFDVEQVERAACGAPARLFGLKKGRLEVGYDADIAVYHKEDIAPLEPQKRVTRCGWSPFADWPALFPRTVYLRAKSVVEDSEVVARAGSGREIHG